MSLVREMAPLQLATSLVLVSLLISSPVGAVEVSNAPKIINLVERLNQPEGTNASFTCSIGSGQLEGLQFEWTKDDKPVSPGGSKLRVLTAPDNFQSVLRVIGLKPDDSGLYTCLARNKHGLDRASTRLSVKVQLKWLVEPRDAQVSAGQPLTVPCSAEGTPSPTIQWARLAPGSGQLGSQLSFESSSLEQAGEYLCRASNGVDNDLVAKVKVTVLGK